VLQLNNIKEGFIVKGAPLMRVLWCKNSSNVSSIAFWCRNKGKLLEAMQCGTPSTLPLLEQNRYGDLDWNGFLQIIRSFANEAVLLYQDERLWLQAQKNRLI
jgi:hypothetical protein